MWADATDVDADFDTGHVTAIFYYQASFYSSFGLNFTMETNVLIRSYVNVNHKAWEASCNFFPLTLQRLSDHSAKNRPIFPCLMLLNG